MLSFEEFSGTVTFDVDKWNEFWKTLLSNEEDTPGKESSEKKSFWDVKVTETYTRKEKYLALNFLLNLAANGVGVDWCGAEGDVEIEVTGLDFDTLVAVLTHTIQAWNESSDE